jgi:hypothetical protein
MLKPGALVGDALEAGSMARAIEDAMVALGVLKLDDETADAAESRRRAFIAIATGVVSHLQANLEIVIAIKKLGAEPLAEVRLLGSAGEIK